MRGAQFGEHAAGGDAAGHEFLGVGGAKDGDALAVGAADAFDIGEEEDLRGLPSGGERRSHLVAVDVVDVALGVAAHAGDDGEESVLAENVQEMGVGANGAADLAEFRLDDFALGQVGVDAGEANCGRALGDKGGDEFVVDGACEDFEDGIDDGGARNAQAVDEFVGDPALFQETRHLLTAAVDYDDFAVLLLQSRDLGGDGGAAGRILEEGAAELDEDFHLQKAFGFGVAEDEVHVLQSLAGGAFDEVVDGGDDEGAAIGSLGEADVAEVCALDGLEVGNRAGLIEADEGFVRVGFLVDAEEVFGIKIAAGGAEVDGFEDAAVDGDELRSEAELAFFKQRIHEDFGYVAVLEERVGGKVLGDFAEARFEAGFSARAGDAGFRVADDAGIEIDGAGVDEGAEGEVGSGGVAAGIGDEAGVLDGVAEELREAVGGFGKELRGGVFFGVPAFENVDCAEAEGAGEVHDFDADVEELGGKFHGDFGRSGKEGGGKARIFDGLDIHGQGKGALVADGLGAGGGVGTVLKEDGF